jgi:hypothetical protein
MASAGEKPWVVDRAGQVYGLQVILLKRMYVLPWSQFLYAEGNSEEVRVVFSTHDVVVKGSGLDSLLADFAAHQIAILQEPARTDKFGKAEGPCILEVAVCRIEADSAE